MKHRWLLLAALALPVAGLSASALWQMWRMASATEWRIPVTGYDPRDLLAGHYAQFRFAWTVAGKPQLCRAGDCAFCLEDRGGDQVVARVVARDESCPARVDPAQSGISVVWPGEASAEGLVAAGRVYIAEGDAERITRILGQGRAVLVARLGADGRLAAERIEAAR